MKSRIGFDNDKYLQMQSQYIGERISTFGEKLYLELGGKLFDDFHASRVLPGFKPDSKVKMLLHLKDKLEIVTLCRSIFAISNIGHHSAIVPLLALYRRSFCHSILYLYSIVLL